MVAGVPWSREFRGPPTTSTLARDTAGRSFVSFLVEEDVHPFPSTTARGGLDRGRQDGAALSTGATISHPNPRATSEKRLKTAQLALARKEKGAQNREKARRTVARDQARIADQRRDGLPQRTTRLIRENHVLCVERLAVTSAR